MERTCLITREGLGLIRGYVGALQQHPAATPGTASSPGINQTCPPKSGWLGLSGVTCSKPFQVTNCPVRAGRLTPPRGVPYQLYSCHGTAAPCIQKLARPTGFSLSRPYRFKEQYHGPITPSYPAPTPH